VRCGLRLWRLIPARTDRSGRSFGWPGLLRTALAPLASGDVSARRDSNPQPSDPLSPAAEDPPGRWALRDTRAGSDYVTLICRAGPRDSDRARVCSPIQAPKASTTSYSPAG